MAALKLGLEEVPVIRLTHLSDIQRRAYILADNKLAELGGGWDEEMLKVELEAVKESDLDHLLTGFTDEELTELLTEDKELNGDPDEVPEAPEEPTTKLGDLWILGDHRIICGDSTCIETVKKLLADEKPHLMVTDPPYGVEYDASWRKDAMPETNPGNRGGMHGKVLNDDKADWRDAWLLFPGDVAYVWHAGNMAHIVAESLIASSFNIRAQIIWAKHQFVISRGHYHPHHEPCWYAVKKGATGHWNGDRKQSTLWEIQKPKENETGHSTQKPVECMKRPIVNNSLPSDSIYDPFLGSGTTLIAAEQLGRKCYGIELNPAYCDVIVKRWETLTGKKATLEPR